jgi:hypothetical protein
VFPLKDDNPTHGTPIVTIGLILANALVFFYQFSLELGDPRAGRPSSRSSG